MNDGNTGDWTWEKGSPGFYILKELQLVGATPDKIISRLGKIAPVEVKYCEETDMVKLRSKHGVQCLTQCWVTKSPYCFLVAANSKESAQRCSFQVILVRLTAVTFMQVYWYFHDNI